MKDEPLDFYSKIQPLVIQDARNQAQSLLQEDQYTVATTQGHTHNGADSLQIPYENLINKFFTVSNTIFGTQAATAGNYGTFYIALFPCLVTAVSEVHQVAGSSANSVFLQLEKLTGTQAPDSGTTLLVPSTGILTAVVAGGGAGYVVNDTITLTGGTASVQAILKVLTIGGGGAVSTVSIQNAGTYSVFPANPVAQGSTSGIGAGATFNVTFANNGFNLKSAANTVQDGKLVQSSNPAVQLTTTYLAKGDRLCMKDIGTLTAVDTVCITVELLVLP